MYETIKIVRKTIFAFCIMALATSTSLFAGVHGSQAQIDPFVAMVGHNERPVQPINHRKILLAESGAGCGGFDGGAYLIRPNRSGYRHWRPFQHLRSRQRWLRGRNGSRCRGRVSGERLPFRRCNGLINHPFLTRRYGPKHSWRRDRGIRSSSRKLGAWRVDRRAGDGFGAGGSACLLHA